MMQSSARLHDCDGPISVRNSPLSYYLYGGLRLPIYRLAGFYTLAGRTDTELRLGARLLASTAQTQLTFALSESLSAAGAKRGGERQLRSRMEHIFRILVVLRSIVGLVGIVYIYYLDNRSKYVGFFALFCQAYR